MSNYNLDHIVTTANKGGALLYISNEVNKVRHNLQINKDKMFESIFVEAISKSQNNVVVGWLHS